LLSRANRDGGDLGEWLKLHPHRNRRFSVSCSAIAHRADTADLAFKGYQAKETIFSFASKARSRREQEAKQR